MYCPAPYLTQNVSHPLSKLYHNKTKHFRPLIFRCLLRRLIKNLTWCSSTWLSERERTEWAACQVLKDHMAVVCGGVWAVVSFSVLLFGVKGLWGGRGDYTPEHILSFKTHTNTLPHTYKQNSTLPVSLTVPPMIQTPLYSPICGCTTAYLE